MVLLVTNAAIRHLADYLVAMHEMPESLKQLTVKHSPDEDARNAKDPRGFCHVKDDEWIIYCAEAIEVISPNIRVGLLLHEVFHLAIPAMSSIDSEIDVDETIIEKIPEAEYFYAPEYRYFFNHKIRTAKNIQSVSSEFLFRLAGGAR